MKNVQDAGALEEYPVTGAHIVSFAMGTGVYGFPKAGGPFQNMQKWKIANFSKIYGGNMTKKPAIITYRAKVRQMQDGRQYLDYRKSVSRSDCNLRPCDHDYYNSSIFPAMLYSAMWSAQNKRAWCYLDELPPGITVDASSFLATVTIHTEV